MISYIFLFILGFGFSYTYFRFRAAQAQVRFYANWVRKLESEVDRMGHLVEKWKREVDESMNADYWAERYKDLEVRRGNEKCKPK